MNATAMALVVSGFVTGPVTGFVTGPVTGEVPIDEEHVRPGYIAMGLVALLAIALFFLLRSFVKQLKKVDFDEQPKNDGRQDQSST